MLKFLNLNPEVFGMDLGDSHLRVVKLRKKGKGFSIVSFNEVALDPGVIKEGMVQNADALVKSIKAVCNNVQGEKLGTKFVAFSLPEEKSFVQVIRMPKMDEEELRQAVPYEVENYIPLPAEKVYIDFEVISVDHTQDPFAHLDLLINAM